MTSVKFESVMSISVTKYDACGNVVSEEIVRACLHMHVACAHVIPSPTNSTHSLVV